MFSGGLCPDTVGDEEEPVGMAGEEGPCNLNPDQVKSKDEEDTQSFIAEAEKETLGPVAVGLNRILDSIQALASSLAMLQVQADCEQHPPSRREREAAALRRQPMQDFPAGPNQRSRAPIPPTHPLSRTAPQVHHPPQGLAAQRDTLAGITATVPHPSLDCFPDISTLLEVRHGTPPPPPPPQSRLERLVTVPLEERPLVLVCLNTPEPHIRVL